MRLPALLLLGGALACAPARAAADPAAAPRPADAVIYPAGDPARPPPPAGRADGRRTPWLIGALACAAGGAAWFWRLRQRAAATAPGGARLVLEETRSLGNRQYLVVAACGGRRLLLGVTPGRIQLLCRLEPEPGGRP